MAATLLSTVLSCYSSDTSLCDNGTRCPADHICAITKGGQTGQDSQNKCIHQRDPCIALSEGEECSFDEISDGICKNNQCTKPLLCGNKKIDKGEACDTLNFLNGINCIDHGYDFGALGCSNDCLQITEDECGSFSWFPLSVDSNDTSIFDEQSQITDIAISDDGTIYIVGAQTASLHNIIDDITNNKQGLIARHENQSWKRLSAADALAPIVGIWGQSLGESFMVGVRGHRGIAEGDQISLSIGDKNVHLARVWALDRDNIFAVGARRIGILTIPVIMRFNDGKWQEMLLPESNDDNMTGVLTGIAGPSPDNIFATGLDGLMLHYDGNSEQYWKRVDSNGITANLYSIAAAPDDGDIISVGEGGVARLHRDGDWIPLTTNTESDLIKVIYAGNHHWFATSKNGEFLSFDENSQLNWTTQFVAAGVVLTSLAMLDDNRLIVVGENGTIMKRHGTDWQKALLPKGASLSIKNFHADASGCIYAAAGDRILMLDPSKGHWEHIPGTKLHHGLYTVHGKNCGGEIFTNYDEADRHGLARLRDGEWQYFQTPKNRQITDIWALDDSTLIIVGRDRLIEKVAIDQDPVQFSRMSITGDTNYQLRTVWGLSERRIYAGGKHGVFLVFDGNMWKPENIGSSLDINEIWASDEDNIFVASDQGIFRKADGTWENVQVDTLFSTANSIWGISSNVVFSGGDRGEITFYDGRQLSYLRSPFRDTPEPEDTKITAVWASGWPGELFIGNDLGEIYSTTQFADEEKSDDE